MEILIVDDDEASARIIHRLVRFGSSIPTGWRVRYVTDAAAGLSAIVHPKVAIAIVDYRMDGIDGEELVRKAISVRPELHGKIIICSGAMFGNAEFQERFGEFGCLRLDKPLSIVDLERTIWAAING
jgi:CheY-like chemotaxis protein